MINLGPVRFVVKHLSNYCIYLIGTWTLSAEHLSRSSKLRMSTRREDRNGPAVGVVGGIGDELIIERQRTPLVDLICIVRLEDFLFAVVQLAITDQQTYATGSEEIAMRAGETVDRPSNSDCVIRPPPGAALDRDAARHATVDVGERQDLVLAVVPAGAGEDADVLGDRLLHVGVEAIFGLGMTDACRRGIDVERRIGRHHGQRLAIVGGVTLVSKDTDPEFAGLI